VWFHVPQFLPLLAHAATLLVAPGARSHEDSLLPTESVRRFRRDGYFVLPDVCEAAEVVRIRETLARLFEQRTGRSQGAQFDMLGLDGDQDASRQPQILHPSRFAPTLRRTDYLGRLAMIARQLLGDDAQFSFDHSILKPARSAASTPWHQDEAHHTYRFLRYEQVSFWLALQDTSIATGCMRYLPGTNRGPVLPHRLVNDDPRIHAIECDPRCIDESKALSMPVRAGSCIFHDGRTVHGALPNTTNQDRLAYIVAFIGPPVAHRGSGHGSALPTATASAQRRKAWLRRGGFMVELGRRIAHTRARTLGLKLAAALGAKRTSSDSETRE
jgi:ectoine hydroxylase-related dioxygenase (phytanoyl-CoA dioxygenase family)